MKLNKLKSEYDDYFDVHDDCYNFDNLRGSENINELMNFFNKDGYVFGGYTIIFKGDHSDIRMPIKCETLPQLCDELNNIYSEEIDYIGSYGSYEDQDFTMQVFPNTSVVLVTRIKKKELSDEKQL